MSNDTPTLQRQVAVCKGQRCCLYITLLKTRLVMQRLEIVTEFTTTLRQVKPWMDPDQLIMITRISIH